MQIAPCPPVAPGILEALIASARLAPSPDNNQPWGFAIEESAILVFHKRELALPSDVRDLFSWIGLGAAIENITLEATRHGSATTVEYQSRPFPITNQQEQIARISLQDGADTDVLVRAIGDRVTNRRLYERTRLTAEECQSLSNVVTEESCRVHWLTEKEQIKEFARLASVADRIRFEHRPFHDEFHKVLRHGSEAARETGDGLEIKSLELPPFAGTLLRLLKPWNRMRLANRFGMSRAFANSSKRQILRSGAIGFLATSDCSDRGYLEAGRMFQRIWLAATATNFAFQPLGSLSLFLTKYEDQGPGAFLPHHANNLEKLRPAFCNLYPQLEGDSPVIAFRIGKAKPPSARSHRFPIESLFTQ